jgi:leucyl/phenylalanyl-tRNA--protein transferase
MPVYQLIDELVFPPLEHAEAGGLLALGGDLSPRRLLLAYSMGIFPWFNEGDPILWWSPDPRCVLEPQALRVSRSLTKELRRARFEVTFDRAFDDVIRACATTPRKQGPGTWITADMLNAYRLLHTLGFAHSVEAWQDGRLVGGLYGVAMGRCFFGESMFHRAPNASKVAFVTLVRQLLVLGCQLIDCQQSSDHLFAFGAREIPRSQFIRRLVCCGISPSTLPPAGVFPV